MSAVALLVAVPSMLIAGYAGWASAQNAARVRRLDRAAITAERARAIAQQRAEISYRTVIARGIAAVELEDPEAIAS